MAVKGEDVTTGIHTSKTYTFLPTVLTMPIKKIFHYKRFESVKMLQIEFDMMDFTHLCPLYKWNFLSSLLKKGWHYFWAMLDMQLHGCSNLAHSHCYNSDNGSFRDCVVSHCGNCVYHTFYLISFSTFSLLILLCCISCE